MPLGTRVAVLGLLAGVMACTADEPACACVDPADNRPVTGVDGVSGDGPYAVVHGGNDVFLVDTDSEVVDSFTLPEHTQVRQPAPGTVSFIGTDTAWHLDLEVGDVGSVTGLPDSARFLADGQRLVAEVHTNRQGDGDEPGPEILDGFFDVLTGDHHVADDLFDGEAVVEERIGDTVVLDVEGRDGLVLVRLDRPLETPVEVASDDLDAVHFSSDGHTAAVLTSTGLEVGDTAAELEAIPDVGGNLLGVVGDDALVADRGRLLRVGPDGARRRISGDPTGLELVHSSGLVVRDRDDQPRWSRVTAASLRPLQAVNGMELASAGDRGWWFWTGERSAPLTRAPLMTMAPDAARPVPVRGALLQLASLVQAAATDDGRFRAGQYVDGDGFTELALADSHSGAVTTLEPSDASGATPVDQPVISPDGAFLASTTVQGPSITRLAGESTRVAPVFDIDSEPGDAWDYHWVVGR